TLLLVLALAGFFLVIVALPGFLLIVVVFPGVLFALVPARPGQLHQLLDQAGRRLAHVEVNDDYTLLLLALACILLVIGPAGAGRAKANDQGHGKVQSPRPGGRVHVIHPLRAPGPRGAAEGTGAKPIGGGPVRLRSGPARPTSRERKGS